MPLMSATRHWQMRNDRQPQSPRPVLRLALLSTFFSRGPDLSVALTTVIRTSPDKSRHTILPDVENIISIFPFPDVRHQNPASMTLAQGFAQEKAGATWTAALLPARLLGCLVARVAVTTIHCSRKDERPAAPTGPQPLARH